MLDKDKFSKKYGTTHKQIHEESYIDTLSEEERDIYDPVEILTGKNHKGAFNKFNNFAKANLGKKYNTTKCRFNSLLKKFIDGKTEEEINEVFIRLWNNSKKGDFKYLQFLFERVAGKMDETINIKTEEPINITFSPNKNSEKRKEENLKNK